MPRRAPMTPMLPTLPHRFAPTKVFPLRRPMLRSGASLSHGGVDRNTEPSSTGFASALPSRSLTGAWIETANSACFVRTTSRRSLTGAWIETTSARRSHRPLSSPSHGGVDRNFQATQPVSAAARRPLTGAWIETGERSATTAIARPYVGNATFAIVRDGM